MCYLLGGSVLPILLVLLGGGQEIVRIKKRGRYARG